MPAADDYTIVELHDIAALRECEAIEQRVWGLSDRETVPGSQLSAAVHAGGVVAGAYRKERLIGFVYGFPSHRPELVAEAGLHSHMLAVVPEARGAGIGRRLKWFQRSWCLTRGMKWMTWTFDPLQARNARLNLEHLGAQGTAYLTDVYGQLGDQLGGQLPTDRLLALWQLKDERVEQLAAGGESEAVAAEDAPTALSLAEDGSPIRHRVPVGEASLSVAIPADASRMIAEDFDLALAWRLALREVMSRCFEHGYRGARFVDGRYLFTRLP